jgi:hypothetical protein
MIRPMLTTELIRQHERDLCQDVETRRRYLESIEADRVWATPSDPMPPPARMEARPPDRSEAA